MQLHVRLMHTSHVAPCVCRAIATNPQSCVPIETHVFVSIIKECDKHTEVCNIAGLNSIKKEMAQSGKIKHTFQAMAMVLTQMNLAYYYILATRAQYDVLCLLWNNSKFQDYHKSCSPKTEKKLKKSEGTAGARFAVLGWTWLLHV